MSQLKLAEVRKRIKELHKKQKFYLDKESDEFIYYFPKFSEKKINELLEELFITIKYCQENKLDKLKDDDQVLQYLQFLIIKHFTSLKEELDNKQFDIHFEAKESLEEAGLYRIFLDHMFDPSEVHDVLDRFNDIIKLGADVATELEKKSQDKDLKVINTIGK